MLLEKEPTRQSLGLTGLISDTVGVVGGFSEAEEGLYCGDSNATFGCACVYSRMRENQVRDYRVSIYPNCIDGSQVVWALCVNYFSRTLFLLLTSFSC